MSGQLNKCLKDFVDWMKADYSRCNCNGCKRMASMTYKQYAEYPGDGYPLEWLKHRYEQFTESK